MKQPIFCYDSFTPRWVDVLFDSNYTARRKSAGFGPERRRFDRDFRLRQWFINHPRPQLI
jgi:hypothetical protein